MTGVEQTKRSAVETALMVPHAWRVTANWQDTGLVTDPYNAMFVSSHYAATSSVVATDLNSSYIV